VGERRSRDEYIDKTLKTVDCGWGVSQGKGREGREKVENAPSFLKFSVSFASLLS
jgi:hypothetical protein